METRLDRRQVIERLRSGAEAVRSCGATSLFVYGSVARDEAVASSDVDLFIDYDSDSRFNAFDLIGIKLMLEERLQSPVDITTRDGLHPRLKAEIEASAIRVF
jgi:predicted nucleotidyltransferase